MPYLPTVCVMTFCCSVTPGSSGEIQEPDADAVEERVTAVVSAAVESGQCAGVSLLVTLDEDRLTEGGWGSAPDGARAGAAALYPADPMLDPWLRTAVLGLVDEGELALETPIGELLDGWEGPGELQLVHLLGHTSGLPEADALPGLTPRGESSRAAMLAALSEAPLLSTPGTCFEVNPIHTRLLEWIVEDATGETLEEVLQARVFGPSGMESTRFHGDGPSSPASHAGTREASTKGDSTGGLVSCAEDLLRWQSALLDEELLSDASTRLMIEPSTGPDSAGIEHGFGMRCTRLGDRTASSFGASVGEYSVHLAHYPSLDLSVALMARGESPALDRLGRRIVRSIFDLPEPEHQTRPISAQELERYTGRYNIGCTQVVVHVDDGQLILDGLEFSDLRFGYQGQHGFLADVDAEVRLTFELDRDGRAASFVLEDAGVHSSGIRLE